jgi:tetratricopeptide (TPR) repeat protein
MGSMPSKPPPAETHSGQVHQRPPRLRRWAWVLWLGFAALSFACLGSIGALSGYRSAQGEFTRQRATQGVLSLKEQFDLGMADFQAGRLDLARQRFEYVLQKDPAYPGAADQLAQVMAILFATATPTPLPATATPTPTRDLRPVEQLFSQAQAQFAQSDWNGTIDTLLALRQADLQYHVVQVDGMLYLALRNRGLQKITEQSNLEGGMYDLSLAERFAPLDKDSSNYRNLARLYMIGSSFFGASPEQAVYYFSMVAAAAPYLRDASGWTARERYRASLIQLADMQAAREDWCTAQGNYELADSIRSDADTQEKAAVARDKCLAATITPPTATPSITLTPTPTGTFAPQPTATQPQFPTATPGPTQPPAATTQPPAATDTPQPPPSETPTTPPDIATDTPVPPAPTDTPQPPPSDTPAAASTEAPPAPSDTQTQGLVIWTKNSSNED